MFRKVEIITIGDELLIGQVVDTNSAWMAQRLNEWGYEVLQVTSVHDDKQHILSSLAAAEARADIVLLTGGLGPTKDDITKHTLCEYFGTELVYRDDIRAHLEQLYRDRPDVLNRLTDTQCLFPANATMLPNKVGSAQGMLWERQALIISMPGVPYEMQWIMENSVRPYLQPEACGSESSIIHRTVQVYGIAESSLALLIEDWESALPAQMHLAYLPKDGVIRLRLSGYGATPEAMQQQLDSLLRILDEQTTDRLPEPANRGLAFATEDAPVEELLGRELKRRGLTIGSAESCTGGKIASLLNRHAGSSAFYWGSVVSYDNSVKQQLLGVREEDLKQFGAVSEPVVRQMAEGARKVLGTDIAIATSGVAGPDGGTPDKPVGTVWIALATPWGTFAHRFSLGKLREQITDRAAQVAMIWLLKCLEVFRSV